MMRFARSCVTAAVAMISYGVRPNLCPPPPDYLLASRVITDSTHQAKFESAWGTASSSLCYRSPNLTLVSEAYLPHWPTWRRKTQLSHFTHDTRSLPHHLAASPSSPSFRCAFARLNQTLDREESTASALSYAFTAERGSSLSTCPQSCVHT